MRSWAFMVLLWALCAHVQIAQAGTIVCHERLWGTVFVSSGTPAPGYTGRYTYDWRLETSIVAATDPSDQIILSVGTIAGGPPAQFQEAGDPCPSGATHVAMTVGDYNNMIDTSSVNETLAYLGIFFSGLCGLGLGYYMFGPRRQSPVEILS